ncbi:MAG: hypothetical protein HY918_00580 [Candidatus Doudnabacteria bacterium]|nr:hypothetical protein [Candidatus Doudnabacteria bacterium]
MAKQKNNKNSDQFELKEFDGHRLVSFIYDPKTNLEGFIAIHRGDPAFGATRICSYQNRTEALRDALRLSKLMSYKAAMAGLKYGGAKSVIILPKQSQNKNNLLKAYAKKVNLLGGHFITGADVGISADDVKLMRQSSPYFIGVNVDPVKYTALGIFYALEESLKEIFGDKSLSNRSFAIQGAGKIGTAFLKHLYGKTKTIYIADSNLQKLKEVKKAFPKVIITSVEDIFKQKVDVLSPCAMGHVLNSETIKQIRAPLIVGGANNQLASPEIGNTLFKQGILYAPDYIVNGGGMISVVSEYENSKINDSKIIKKLDIIPQTLGKVIKKSLQQKLATNIVADRMAEKIFNNLNI